MYDLDSGTAADGSSDNIFIGVNSGAGAWVNVACNKNVAIGNYAMDAALNDVLNNVAIGYDSLGALIGGGAGSQGQDNTAVGYQSGDALTSGTQNTIIGSGADAGGVDLQNTTVIGYGTTGINASHTVTIGNASIDNVYMAQDSQALVHSAGIQFAGTQVANAGANVLDDYEEGTWTGVFSNGTNPCTMDGSNTTGFYTKVGNLVHVSGYFSSTSLGSATSGNLRMTGLPFTVNNSGSAYSGGGVAYGAGLAITAGHSVSYHTALNYTFINFTLWDATTGSTDVQMGELTADGKTIIGFSYRVA